MDFLIGDKRTNARAKLWKPVYNGRRPSGKQYMQYEDEP